MSDPDGPVISYASPMPARTRVCRMASTSLALAIVSLPPVAFELGTQASEWWSVQTCILVWLAALLVASALAIAAIVRTGRSRGELSGRWLAVAALCCTVPGWSLVVYALPRSL